jgi:hypothetical protein
VTFDRSMVTSLDWSSYPILTFSEVPDVVIDLIDRPEKGSLGRRGAPLRRRAFGDRRSRLRSDRRAPTLGAIYPGKGASGALAGGAFGTTAVRKDRPFADGLVNASKRTQSARS